MVSELMNWASTRPMLRIGFVVLAGVKRLCWIRTSRVVRMAVPKSDRHCAFASGKSDTRCDGRGRRQVDVLECANLKRAATYCETRIGPH